MKPWRRFGPIQETVLEIEFQQKLGSHFRPVAQLPTECQHRWTSWVSWTEEQGMGALEVVVGRQPIFDRALSVFGYELLFRPLQAVTAADAAGPRGDQMTAEVLFGSLAIGVDRLVGSKRLFCNGSRGVLTGKVPILLSPTQTVVEVLESVAPDDEVLAGCKRLRDEGFTLALDDVSEFVDVERLIDLATIVKIDLQAIDSARLPGLVDRCRRPGVALVAEKVETADEFDRCVALGFDYFQGYLLARPCKVPGRTLDPSRLTRLRLAADLLDHECPISELEDIIRRDPAMTLQVLRLAGVGAGRGMYRAVQTLRQALVLVGWRRLQSWVSLLLMGDIGQASEEVLTTALARARMCEILAQETSHSRAESAFTAGMLSSFDVLLGMNLEDVLGSLPLDGVLRRALLEAQGPLGRLVHDVADFQLGRPEAASRSGLDEITLGAAAVKALMWAVEMATVLSGID